LAGPSDLVYTVCIRIFNAVNTYLAMGREDGHEPYHFDVAKEKCEEVAREIITADERNDFLKSDTWLRCQRAPQVAALRNLRSARRSQMIRQLSDVCHPHIGR
jgi:hypothetical protein